MPDGLNMSNGLNMPNGLDRTFSGDGWTLLQFAEASSYVDKVGLLARNSSSRSLPGIRAFYPVSSSGMLRGYTRYLQLRDSS
jgi:hypothetical protein